MKKTVLFLLAVALLISFTACSSNNKTTPSDTTSSTQGTAAQQDAPADAVELLNGVWEKYAEDDKFAVSGGDTDNMNMSGAGKFGVADASALDSALGFPAADIDQIDDAASLLHMMNANTFTCGAYRLKDGADAAALAADIQQNIQHRQWLCGFPDKLVVASVDGYIVSFFGENTILDTFKTNLTAAYPSAKILCEEAIA